MIAIQLESPDPPQGWVRKVGGGRGEVRFSGWIGLMQALWLLTHDEASDEAATELPFGQ